MNASLYVKICTALHTPPGCVLCCARVICPTPSDGYFYDGMAPRYPITESNPARDSGAAGLPCGSPWPLGCRATRGLIRVRLGEFKRILRAHACLMKSDPELAAAGTLFLPLLPLRT